MARTPDTSAPQSPRARSAIPKMTRQRLRNIARFHVERFATTAAHLRRVLFRRVARAARAHGLDAAEMRPWVDDVVAALVKSGAVDDGRYAAARARSLRRLGRSPAKIRAHLAAKGVAHGIIEAVLADTAKTAGGGDAAFAAAVAYARRRRLGPFRTVEDNGDVKAWRARMTKDLAALGRAGFSYDVARRVMALTADEAKL